MMEYVDSWHATRELRHRNYELMMPHSFYTTGIEYVDRTWILD
ncbi:MAG: hypothetical protein ABIF10_04525 [Candidatus Woesearchaeota archaeon]